MKHWGVLARALLLTVALCAVTPAHGAPSTPATVTSALTEYIVKAGDTLYRISKAYQTTVEELLRLNDLDHTTVEIGQVLNVPNVPGASVAPPPTTAPVTTGPIRGPQLRGHIPPEVTHRKPGAPVGATGGLINAASHGSGAGSPDTAYLGGLGFAMQTYNNCGPASVSSVLAYYGIHVTQEELRRILRPHGGYMQVNVIAPYVRRHGLQATPIRNGDIATVKRLVGNGIPVIVLQWLDRPGVQPHFRVVRGFDDDAGLVWVSDNMIGPAAHMTYRDFDQLWNTQGRQLIPVYPAGIHAHVQQLIRGL